MDYIIKDERLELKYVPGKGSWTYHLQIPNSKDIKGKWGDIKVSGFVDHYKLESKNLAPMKGDDKLLSINNTIRKAINKDGGDFVTVTLFLLNNKEHINKTQILNSFNDAGVLEKFERLPDDVQNEILRNILEQKTDENQINKIVFYIKKLSK